MNGHQNFAEELLRLRSLEDHCVEKLVWYEAAKSAVQIARSLNDGAFGEEIWNYLSDYDIRLKDAKYRAVQLSYVDAYIKTIQNALVSNAKNS